MQWEGQVKDQMYMMQQQSTKTALQHEQDKKEAIAACQKTWEKLHDEGLERVREETLKHSQLHTDTLRSNLQTALSNVDEVKKLYLKVCDEKEALEKNQNEDSSCRKEVEERLYTEMERRIASLQE